MKARRKRDEPNVCFIIIPPTDKVKRLTIPLRLIKVALLFIATIGLGIILIFGSILVANRNLKDQYKLKVAEVESLIEENKNKNIEIHQLKQQNSEFYEKSAEIQDKLMELENIKRQLEKMAGINTSSRGSSLTNRASSISTKNFDSVQELEETLDYQVEELKNFTEKIEKRLEYLKTIPDYWPAVGRLTSTFGNRKDPITRKMAFHYGIDIANWPGTNIYAAGKGKVEFAGYRQGYGKLIIIDHQNGYKSLYAHNSKLLVQVGDTVDKGQTIAKMGSTGRSTGSHLHFEIHYRGTPIDPLTILNKQ